MFLFIFLCALPACDWKTKPADSQSAISGSALLPVCSNDAPAPNTATADFSKVQSVVVPQDSNGSASDAKVVVTGLADISLVDETPAVCEGLVLTQASSSTTKVMGAQVSVSFSMSGNENCAVAAKTAGETGVSLSISGNVDGVSSADAKSFVVSKITACTLGTASPKKGSLDFALVSGAALIQDPTVDTVCANSGTCAQPVATFSGLISGPSAADSNSVYQDQSAIFSISESDESATSSSICLATAEAAELHGNGLHIEATIVSQSSSPLNQTNAFDGRESGVTVVYSIRDITTCSEVVSVRVDPLPKTLLKSGEWGAPQGDFTVSDDGTAILQLACASLQISTPIMVDVNGKFIATGTYQSGGGAVPSGAIAEVEAEVSGQIQGEVLSLSLAFTGAEVGNPPLNYSLKFNVVGQPILCE